MRYLAVVPFAYAMVTAGCDPQVVELLDDAPHGCSAMSVDVVPVPATLMFVVDRSASMNQNAGGVSRWEIVRDALVAVATEYQDRVQFGLALYPGVNQSCSVGATCQGGRVFAQAASTALEIDEAFDNARLCGNFGTPTGEALESLLAYPAIAEGANTTYAALVTDGKASCEDPTASVSALTMRDPAIETFVIGFGADVDASELSAMAVVGRTALPSAPHYYQVDDAVAVNRAFAEVADRARTCVYSLASVPIDPMSLSLRVDGTEVVRDGAHVDGWDHDPVANQIRVYGPSCDRLRRMQAQPAVQIAECAAPIL